MKVFKELLTGVFYCFILDKKHLKFFKVFKDRYSNNYINIIYFQVAEKVKEFFHHEGIHSTTIQPEFIETMPHSKLASTEDCVLACPKVFIDGRPGFYYFFTLALNAIESILKNQ